MLRQLLGLPGPTLPDEAPVEASPIETPILDVLPPQPVEAPASKPATSRPAPAAPAAKPRPAKAAPAKKALPASVLRKAVDESPSPPTAPTEKAGAAPAPVASTPVIEVPPAGSEVTAANMERWKHLLGPSIQWAVGRGAKLDIVATTPTPIEPRREEATQRYHSQVRLAPDKLSMENYVAGIPFPFVRKDDPDLAIKLMFNYESRIVVDDVDLRHSACDTGGLSAEGGVTVEKHYEPEHFRRLFYVSRLYHEPMPTWRTVDGVRYRELAGPLAEPFDLKGAGYTYARYLDPARQDDSWVYYPSSRRVRRLGTAQRSEGIFGQDIDLDSFAGFAGNPAWSEWKYLGEKTILASMHAQNLPAKFQASPVDFFPDDVWEPREVHVIVGTSRLAGSSFSRRVLYIDREALLIPFAELYDMKGGLWKSLVQTWKSGSKPIPTATRAVYDEEQTYIASISLFDMQLDHVTRCELPSSAAPGEEGWYFNFGEEEGTVEEEFTVSGLISRGR